MDWKQEAERLFFELNKTWPEIDDAMSPWFSGLTPQQIHNKVRGYLRGTKRYKNEHIIENLNDKFTSVKTTLNGDGTREYEDLIKLADCEDLSPDDIMVFHGLDPEAWMVKQYTTNRWHGQIKGGSRIAQYQSKLVVEPIKAENITIQTAKRVFAEMSSGYKPKEIQYQPKRVPLLLETNIPDLHLGKLAWRGETGEDYDFKIAKERFENAIGHIAHEAKKREIEKIIFPIGNDFFNSDTTTDTTTKGTQQNNDVRWPKMYNVGCEIMIDAIAALRKIAPVNAFYVGANHDKMMAYFLVEHIRAFYRNDKSVNVSDSPQGRKYIEYFNTLIGFAHGDDERGRIKDLMQIEAREAYGRTQYHEYHVAHLHTERAGQVKLNDEMGGVIIRVISAVCGTDVWHYDNGFVGSVKKAQNFIYDRKKGLVEIIHSVVGGE